MCVRASVFTCRHFHSAFAPLFCFFFCLQRLVQSHNRPCNMPQPPPHHTTPTPTPLEQVRRARICHPTRRAPGVFYARSSNSVFLRVDPKTDLSDRVYLPRFSFRHFRRLLPSVWWPLYSRQGTSWNQLAQVYRNWHRTSQRLLCLLRSNLNVRRVGGGRVRT